MRLYYSHHWKKGAAIKRDLFNYSPTFISLIDNKKLEQQKQKSVYVGLPIKNGKIEYKERILSPFSIKEKDVKKLISLNNDILLEMCFYNIAQDGFFRIEEMDELIHNNLSEKLKKSWPYKSGVKSRKWEKIWHKKILHST